MSKKYLHDQLAVSDVADEGGIVVCWLGADSVRGKELFEI